MASVGFRWLDILEKEFDKAFVDLDLSLGEIEADEANVVFNARQKLCTLGSCFAQLSHKAQTIFQNSAKVEAELIHLRAELIDSKSKKELLENELHSLLLQLHSSQLAQLPDSLGNKKLDQHFKPDVNAIKKRLEAEMRQSPLRMRRSMSTDAKDNSRHTKESELKFSAVLLEPIHTKVENAQLSAENAALRNDVLALTAEVYGAKLAAKYLDKELAGRIQQLQLLGKEMRGELRDKLWSQLESEILLQRHKTVVRACRRNSSLNNSKCLKPPPEPNGGSASDHFGDVRMVMVKRKPEQGLGISITGGREHGVPILISELEPNGPAALSEQLYIGDAILYVNDIDLRNACHKEAVTILQQQTGDCALQVQYVAADDSDNSLEEDGLNFRFFNEEVCDVSPSSETKRTQDIVNTPTAPRTPESSSMSRLSHSSRKNSSENLTDNLIDNGNVTIEAVTVNNNINNNNNNNNILPDNVTKYSDNLSNVDTSELVLLDNATNNIIKLEDFKKVDVCATIESNFNCSINSLISDNLSSPMQTSTDVYLDSEVLSTDIASNDSHSPKNLQAEQAKAKASSFSYDNVQAKLTTTTTTEKPATIYRSNESLLRAKSDQSLLNSNDSAADSSPVRNTTNSRHRHHSYKKQKKVKKKYFGVKTLQSIFNKRDGYSDISTTASELGDEAGQPVSPPPPPPSLTLPTSSTVALKSSLETCPQFEKHIHSIISDILSKGQLEAAPPPPLPPQKPPKVALPVAPKKYFSLHGQNLRVSKALRLCPNENLNDAVDLEQRKEKLLARYVYNANSVQVDGVGDPDFGTPV